VKNQSKWGAKLALACSLALLGVVLTVYVMVGYLVLDLPFPIGLIVVPIDEIIVLAVTLLFARYKGASLKKLGLKRVSLKILAIVSVAVVPLYLLGAGIVSVLTIVFGPSPMASAYAEAVVPKDAFQLTALVVISLVLVGPVEELAFRGFVQKGFENSLGKMKGLLIASFMFGLVHITASPYNVVTAFAGGLVLGYVWQKTGENTTASALMHGILNAVAFILAYFITT
jgi:membrane protease YdiL (CAAX protease family)